MTTKKIVIISAVVLVLGLTAVVVTKKIKAKSVSKADEVNGIMSNPASGVGNSPAAYSTLMGFGDDYIAAWYNALKAGKPVFLLSGKYYRTAGGTVVKPAAISTQNLITDENDGYSFSLLDVYTYSSLGIMTGMPLWNWLFNKS